MGNQWQLTEWKRGRSVKFRERAGVKDVMEVAMRTTPRPLPGLVWVSEFLCHRDASDLQTFPPVLTAPKLQSPRIEGIWLSFWCDSFSPSLCIVSGVGKRCI